MTDPTRRTHPLAPMLALSAVVIAVSPAWAQARKEGVNWSMSARIEHESNVLKISNAAIIPAGFGRSDDRLGVEAHVDAAYPLGRQSLFLQGTAGYEFYRRNSRLDRERIDFLGGVDLRAGNCSGRIAEDYARHQSDLGDTTTAGSLFAPVNLQQTLGFSGGLSCGGPVGLRPGISLRHEEIRNSALIRRPSNVTSDTITGRIGYTRPSFGTLSLYGSHRAGRYPRRIVMVLGAPMVDGISVWSAGLEYERKIGARLGGIVSAGYTHVDPKIPGTPKFDGLSYSGELNFNASDHLAGTLSFGRSAEQSNLFLTSYTIRDHAALAAHWALDDRMTLETNASYMHRRYIVSAAIPGAVPRASEDQYVAGAGLNRKIGRVWRAAVDLSHEWRNSAMPILNYDDTRASLTIGIAM